MTLATWLPAELCRILLVFCRVSTAMLLLPGFGEASVPVRIRILAGLAIAFCMAPLAGPAAAVPNVWGLLGGIVAEVAAGALLGTLARVILSGVQMAGQLLGQCIGISNVFALGVGLDSSATLGAAVYVACLAALFAMDGHHPGLRAILDSYDMIPLGTLPPGAVSARAVTEVVGRAFHLAIQLSLPFLVLSLLFNIALAGINRAMPAMPVFMIGAPALLMAGLMLLGAAAPTLLGETLGAYAEAFVLTR